MSISDERLREHLAVGKESWSAMRSLTASEVYEAVTELLALRHQSSEGDDALWRKAAIAARAGDWWLLDEFIRMGEPVSPTTSDGDKPS